MSVNSKDILPVWRGLTGFFSRALIHICVPNVQHHRTIHVPVRTLIELLINERIEMNGYA